MDTDLLSHTRAFLAHYQPSPPAPRLLVAVSGGPDSLALAHLLVHLRDLGLLELHIAHLDHGFRGAESAADAAFVGAFAAHAGTPATIEHADVPALARRWRLSNQAAARRARYAFLARVAHTLRASAVVTAHHADDQAETVLLHLVRGAGPAGLRGMRPSVPWAEWATDPPAPTPDAPPLLRPLLPIARAELEAYCRAAGLTPRSDPSNSNTAYARTRVRRTVLPALQELNPHVAAALGRTAAVCAEDYAFMQSQLDAVWPALAHPEVGWIGFDRRVWTSLHTALQRYALRRAMEWLGRPELSFSLNEAAGACIASGAGKRLDLGPDVLLETEYVRFIIRLRNTVPPVDAPQLAAEYLPLAVGRNALGNGWVCIIQAAPPQAASPWWVGLTPVAGATLALRRRQAGDRFLPAGGVGRRRLQDLFVDSKVPRAQRAAWPLLLVDDQIAWVAGLRTAAPFAVAPDQATIWVGIVRDAI